MRAFALNAKRRGFWATRDPAPEHLGTDLRVALAQPPDEVQWNSSLDCSER